MSTVAMRRAAFPQVKSQMRRDSAGQKGGLKTFAT